MNASRVMKRIVLVAALAALSSAPVFSQTRGEKPVTGPAPAMKEEPRAGQDKGIVLIQGPGQSSVKEDARHCLDHSTNIEIIKCAEPYLPGKQKRT